VESLTGLALAPALQPWVVGVILILMVVALVKNLAPPDVVLLGSAVLMGLLGIVSPEAVFSGFSNTGMLTVAALFVVAAGLRETGALDNLGRRFLGSAKTERSVFIRLALSTPIMSAFLNNTPIVAMFIPVITSWCKANSVSASRLLLPLSYLTILGGTCTLIGTSTNLLVSGLIQQEGMQPMGLFELSWVGVPYALVGTLYLLFIGRRLLPERRDLLERLGDSRREYLVNMEVKPGCRLAGQRVDEAGLRHLPGLFLIEVTRDNEVITPVEPNQRLELGDILTFTGVVATIVDLERIPGLEPVADINYETAAAARRSRLLHEAVVSNTSPLIGKNIRDAEFRAMYNAAVLAVHRGGERLKGRVGDIRMRSGDTLLLQAGPHFQRAYRNNPDFYLVSPVEDSRPLRDDKAVISVGLLALLVLLMATNVVPIVMAAFLIAGLMMITRCISANAARQSLDWQTLITIAASFGVSEGLKNSGLVSIMADNVVAFSAGWGAIAVLAAIYLMTSMFTEIVTNNAAAAIMFPFAVAMAESLGVDARPFIMAITFAASASFVTPIGYQTNLMVYGPGGYQFRDFVRVGLPLNIILLILATILIPFVWPFVPR
jgi:di/tricarboxylate transporter